MHKENDHAGAFLLLHGRYSVLAHYLKVSLKNSRFLKIPKLHPQKGRLFFYNYNAFDEFTSHIYERIMLKQKKETKLLWYKYSMYNYAARCISRG